MSDEITEKTISDEIDALSIDAGPDPEVLLSGEQQNNNEEDSINEYSGLLVTLFTPLFSLITPAWNIQSQEIKALSDSYASVLQKYFPDGTKAVGAELGAALVTVAIFAPRVSLPRDNVLAEDETSPVDQVLDEPKKKAAVKKAKSKKVKTDA